MRQGKQKERCRIPGTFLAVTDQSFQELRKYPRERGEQGMNILKKTPPDERVMVKQSRDKIGVPQKRLEWTYKASYCGERQKYLQHLQTPFRKTSESRSENFLTTLEPPLKSVGQQELKGGPSIMERIPQVFLQKSKVFGINIVKKTQ